MPRIVNLPLATLLLLCLTACTGTKRNLLRVGENRPATPGKPTTLTLVLKAVWNPDSSVHFSVYNDIRNSGLQPAKSISARKRNSGFLLCFTGVNGAPGDSVYISHPLREKVETTIAPGKAREELFTREEAYTEVSVLYTPEIKKLVCTDLETQKQQTLDIR